MKRIYTLVIFINRTLYIQHFIKLITHAWPIASIFMFLEDFNIWIDYTISIHRYFHVHTHKIKIPTTCILYAPILICYVTKLCSLILAGSANYAHLAPAYPYCSGEIARKGHRIIIIISPHMSTSSSSSIEAGTHSPSTDGYQRDVIIAIVMIFHYYTTWDGDNVIKYYKHLVIKLDQGMNICSGSSCCCWHFQRSCDQEVINNKSHILDTGL